MVGVDSQASRHSAGLSLCLEEQHVLSLPSPYISLQDSLWLDVPLASVLLAHSIHLTGLRPRSVVFGLLSPFRF